MSSLKIGSITIPPELEAEMTPAVRGFVGLLLGQIAKLEARIEELERQVKGKMPQNSSLPPSTQHPHNRPQPPKRKSKKKRGGQPGHEKHERPLIPTNECDDVQKLRPTECRRCGTKLSGSDPEPLRHQVWELPEIKPIVTEYQRHRLACPCCGEKSCADLPPGVPQGQSGPHLMAFVALLMAYYRQSKRRTADFLGMLLGQPCCPALTVKLQNQVTQALRPSYQELAAELPTQEHLNIDETGTKEAGGKAWLWTFVARAFTVFAVRATREATALGVFLTEKFHGIVTCDRAKMYWQVGRLQWCWAHLKRDFQAMIESGDKRAKWQGERLRAATCELFEHWADYRHGRISRAALVRRMAPVRRKVERLLLRGTQCGHAGTRGTCRELYEHRPWLWTFLRHEGVEPTNNAGERSLRHAVIWRKLSFGTQSAAGSRFVETMLTVIETCRQQNRNVFTFVTTAVESHLNHQSAPSLLPRV
ncbi:MAG TPA: IS66 family transposase [Planctomycetaceae bacterium]|nr:IS66 family transposase [Planctomycetaceae bacterium]